MKNLLYFFAFLFSSATLFAQGSISGTLMDKEAHESLISASVILKGADKGTVTDYDGTFSIGNLPAGDYVVEMSYIGFTTIEMPVTVSNGNVELGTINLESDAIGLEEINVVASVVTNRKTPIAVSTISGAQVEAKLGGRELPEILNSTPSVYATKSGGGFGDSRINIRGFDQRNIAVLINGVPVNDMENGWVYWSNWAGLGDAVRTMQVQRGLGASKLAINSVGGTMNIITKTTDVKKGGSVKTEMTSYGKKKTLLSLSSGRMDNGLAITAVGSRTSGTGYVDGTYIDAWSYYLGIAKDINDHHKLQFTVIGAPQKHGQRDASQYSAQTFDEQEQNGAKYNPNWGYAKGEFLNERNNFYHKPQIALNHYWTVNSKNFLATSAYVSYGSGGGSGILSHNKIEKNPFKYGPGNNAAGQRNWDAVIDANANIPDSLKEFGAYMIMRNSMNNHFWTGVLSTLRTKVSDAVTITSGLDVRHYKGEHYREVRDLMGAKHWKDKVNPTAKVGDRIAYDNDGLVTYTGLFAQAEYSNDLLSGFLGGSVSNTWFGREDRYNFARGRGDLKADVVTAIGYNAKAGLNVKVNENNNVFMNVGYYSRAPFHNFVYINYSNTVNPDLANENILGLEVGYALEMQGVKINVNGFHTSWNDRWVRQRVSTQQKPDGTTAIFQVKNQTHQGVEVEVKTNPIKSLELGLLASIGSFKYQGDFDATLLDSDTREVIDTVSVFADGIHVADQPQTQYGGFLNYHVGQFEFGAEFLYYDRLYAKFEVASYNEEADRKDSYKLPSYGMLNANMAYKFKLTDGLKAKAYIQGENLGNVNTPIEGWGPNKDDFNGFWSWGRNFNFGMKVQF